MAKVTHFTNMKTPAFLSKGDCIGLASPARKISNEELLPALSLLREKGFSVQAGEALFAQHHQYAGTDAQRAEHFQSLLDDPTVKAILCVRGGYGTMRIIDQLDFSRFQQQPKWIAGYSDISVLHARLHHSGIKSLHATMPVNFGGNTSASLVSLFESLKGNHPSYTLPDHPLNRKGNAKAQLIGGNLSILYSLQGSVDFPDLKGKILFLEDLDEYLYHIDRMMLSLKRAGAFEKLSGLVVGSLSEMRDNAVPFGKNAEEIVYEHLADYSFPLCFGFPAGHQPDNRCLVMGQRYQLQVQENTSLIPVR